MEWKKIKIGDLFNIDKVNATDLCLSKSIKDIKYSQCATQNCSGPCKNEPNILLDSDNEIWCPSEHDLEYIKKASDSELLLMAVKTKSEWARERIKIYLKTGAWD